MIRHSNSNLDNIENSVISKYLQVDGFNNEKLQSIKFQKFAIDCAHFTVDGKQFIAGSRTQRNFYCYDLLEGRSMFVPVHHNIGQTRMDVS